MSGTGTFTKSPLQLKRGPSAKADIYTGYVGEPLVTIDKNEQNVITSVELSIHDGSTPGGIKIANKSYVDQVSTVATTTAQAIVEFGNHGQVGNSSSKNSVDADTLEDSGNYYATGCTAVLNWPVTGSCFCRVFSNGTIITQEVTTPDTNKVKYKRTFNGEIWGEWVNSTDTLSILQAVYPVGAVYISTVSTSPATLFGFGTWTQIEGQFLLASSSIYSAGTTGGSATHNITVDELPSHTHTISEDVNSSNSGSVSVKYGIDSFESPTGAITGSGENHYKNTVETNALYEPESDEVTTSYSTITVNTSNSYVAGSTGSGQAMSLMPPYLSVYMWRRTA